MDGEGSVSPKKSKLEISIPHDIAGRLYESATDLERISNSLAMLQFTYTNGSKSASFSTERQEEGCYVEIVRSTDVEATDKKLAAFADIFADGMRILKSFLKDQNDLPESRGELLALKRLATVIKKCDVIGAKLLEEALGGRKDETQWTVILSHHLLSELAVSKSYVIDDGAKNKSYINVCDCCGEKLLGSFGDCSFGNKKIWHGSADVILGHKGDVALKFFCESEEEDVTSKDSTSYFEIEDSEHLMQHYTQIIPEAIVFGFVQKKSNPAFDNFLIPIIAISKQFVLFVFYDPENDILLESTLFPLFVERRQMHFTTLIALWLTVNYRYFCSGITKAMAEKSFTSNFLRTVSEDKKKLYFEEVQMGGVRTGDPLAKRWYIDPLSGSGYVLERSEPYKSKFAPPVSIS